MREIQQENRELRAALEEHQTALEHIMTKYRQHTTEQIYNSRIDLKTVNNEKYNEIIRQQAEKIHEMASVMKKAASMHENDTYHEEEMLTRLRAENKVIINFKLIYSIALLYFFLGTTLIYIKQHFSVC